MVEILELEQNRKRKRKQSPRITPLLGDPFGLGTLILWTLSTDLSGYADNQVLDNTHRWLNQGSAGVTLDLQGTLANPNKPQKKTDATYPCAHPTSHGKELGHVPNQDEAVINNFMENCTIVIAYRHYISFAFQDSYTIWIGDTSEGTNGRFAFGFNGAVPTRQEYPRVSYNGDAGGGANSSLVSTISNTAYNNDGSRHIFAVRWGIGTIDGYEDSVTPSLALSGLSSPPNIPNTARVRIFNQSNQADRGWLFEVAVWQTKLSDGDMNAVINQMGARYGIAIT